MLATIPSNRASTSRAEGIRSVPARLPPDSNAVAIPTNHSGQQSAFIGCPQVMHTTLALIVSAAGHRTLSRPVRYIAPSNARPGVSCGWMTCICPCRAPSLPRHRKSLATILLAEHGEGNRRLERDKKACFKKVNGTPTTISADLQECSSVVHVAINLTWHGALHYLTLGEASAYRASRTNVLRSRAPAPEKRNSGVIQRQRAEESSALGRAPCWPSPWCVPKGSIGEDSDRQSSGSPHFCSLR
jgi:hypothetical protein